MLKVLIFDFDGVIIKGSNEGYFTCYHKALDAVGVHLGFEEERKRILEIWGKGYKLQLQKLLAEHPELLLKAIKAYEKCYYSPLFSKNIRLVKDADKTLKNLANNYKLAIASGMMRKTLDKFLQQFKIADLFELVVTSDEIENPDDKKPAPYMLNKILMQFFVDKSEAVYVGDALSDVKMAKNAGITPVVVLSGHLTGQEAKKLDVEHIIFDLTYLPQILKNW